MKIYLNSILQYDNLPVLIIQCLAFQAHIYTVTKFHLLTCKIHLYFNVKKYEL